MATRRRTTAARKTSGRRKTTARRRRSPARRKTTTRRRKTTRRKAPARRKTTRRKTTSRRRRATRRKPTTRRKTTTRRRRTTRRKPSTRRKTTTRRRRTARRKPTTRRRRTTRRKAGTRRRRTTARRKSGARRKSAARRRSGARALMSRRRASKMSLKGFKSFVKDHLAGRALAVTAFGLMLPALGVYTATKLNIGSMVSRVPVLGTIMGNAYGRAALGGAITAGLSYLAVGAGFLGRNEAIMANSIALVLLGLNAMRNAGHLPTMLQDAVPSNSATEGSAFFGYGGSYIGGYNGGYLGYLGQAMGDDDEPAGELFGYSAAPQVNVF